MNKYYTPKIEEFYIGFEFEAYYRTNDLRLGLKDRYTWGEGVLLQTPDLQLIPHKIKDNTIRVKYLDQEDIESLDFVHVGDKLCRDAGQEYIKGYNDPREIKDTIAIYHIERNNYVLIYIGHHETPRNDWETLFTGIVKNKSELKRILTQIGVIKE